MEYLYDREFLKALDEHRDREIYVRLIALTWDELPIETIEGRATSGSINIDGTSAIRRTCNLSLVAEDININEFYWGMKTKFRLEVGIKNKIDSNYEYIIWFNQGIYVITAFNVSHNVSSYNISVSGKDKMCLVNGELGGNVYASIDFGVQEIYSEDNKTVEYRQIPIKEILYEGIHTYTQEPYSKIMINDLDELGLELLEYRGDKDLYVFMNDDTNEAENFTLKPDFKVQLDDGTTSNVSELAVYNNLFELDSENTGKAPTKIYMNNKPYTVAKISYGQALGYRPTELVYAGDLIASVGEAFTSILDKIKNMLVDFEYFYDINGNFVFQRKATYINQSWSPKQGNQGDEYMENAAYTSAIEYYFENNNLITSYNHNPQLNNVKNDYSVWGARKGVGGAEIPIHFRYAIDKKPTGYKSFDGEVYESATCDWRELIYQMALDYFQHHTESNFTNTLVKNNPWCINGVTGYEQYYTDIQGFWRDIYNEEDKCFNEDVINHPENLSFWFDFLDTQGELNQFSVKNIGDRTKSINDKNITSIYYREIPKLLFCSAEDFNNGKIYELTGYQPVRFGNSNLSSLCTISAQGKSAKDRINELLYTHGYCSEAITIQSVPIYYLNPNTRIYVHDDLSGIDGEYLISRISLPLTYNGTMSINATKVPERII